MKLIMHAASQVELSHMYVDNAAMQLIRNPKQATLLSLYIYILYYCILLCIYYILLCSTSATQAGDSPFHCCNVISSKQIR